MRPKYFFQCCSDLVRWRWKCVIGPKGGLNVLSDIIILPEDSIVYCHPIFAVAYEVNGFRAQKPNDIWTAVGKLGLPSEFALLVVMAGVKADLNARAMAVREELVEHLRPKPGYAPPLNSLRVPVLSLA